MGQNPQESYRGFLGIGDNQVPPIPRNRLVRREAIQQSGTAGTRQVLLATAPRTMRRGPRRIASAMPVMMPDLGATLAGAGPIVTGMVALLPREIGSSVVLRPGQDIVPVWLIASPVNPVTVLVQGSTLDDIRVQVQLVQITGNQLSSRVIPGPGPDPVSGRYAALVLFLRLRA